MSIPENSWAPFAGAAILAPLVPAVPALLLLMLLTPHEIAAIPAIVVFSAPLGAPTYALFGLPAFYLAQKWYGGGFWLAGLAANIVSAPFVYGYLSLSAADSEIAAAILIGFGCIFAPVWGTIFGALYRRFTR